VVIKPEVPRGVASRCNVAPVAEILGLAHYPPLCLPDADMAGILRWTLQDPSIPATEKDVAHWPAPMRAEWADDFGARAVAAHRQALVQGFERVRAGDYDAWRSTPLKAVEDAGQQEVLNWFALAGAMAELGARLEWCEFVETHVFNSNKVFAVYVSA